MYSMEVKSARRVPEGAQHGRVGGRPLNKRNVCAYWLAGRCTRNPCRFLHTETPLSQSAQPKHAQRLSKDHIRFPSSNTWKRIPDGSGKTSSTSPPSREDDSGKSSCTSSPSREAGSERESTQNCPNKVCEYWITGNCVRGDKCEFLHSWLCGKGFSLVTKLEGHNKAITGIALPAGSDKLFSGGKDKAVRIWDCNSGQCVGMVSLEGEISCMTTEGPLVFAGLQNAVKGWDTKNQINLTLTDSFGQVYAMVVENDMLFTGTENATILAWKSNASTGHPEVAASLRGHSRAVVSLIVGGGNRMYSGSMDNTVRVWDLNTLECIHILNGHTSAVMSLLCWDSYLLSGSLDGTIKVWAATESGDLEVVYTHKEEYGILALRGIYDAEEKPILLCSCNDNTVRLYDLPSFAERGRLFTKKEVRTIETGPGGLFFTGDATGQLAVWRLDAKPTSSVAS